jgi:predicted lipoprotein with Yx(FWY)xxD motif
VVDVRESAVGPILTDPAGRTLYTYKLDVPGLSTCVGSCAEDWPPFTPAEADREPEAPLSLIERSDGRSQWALKARPLYRYSGDEEPGAVQGDRFAPWSVARPELAQ